jgi:signal transduction histidine kinase
MSSMIVKLRELYVFEKRAEEKAREASQLKSNMLSLVSHEFGNNLTTLKMVPFLLRDSEKGEIPIERQQLYSMLERVVTHLSGAVSNFLNLNRLESGKFTPAIRRIPIRVLIHEVILLLEPQIDGKNVALKIDFPTQPVPARADPDALALVMTNLIGNAFKYTPSGGEVTVRIATEGSPASDVLISIEDTGIGISQEDQKRLTSAFFRAEEGKSAAKGFGVGLKVARDLLESQGSQLRLESAPGKGSRFFFRLPLWPSEPHPTTPDMGAS